ncbi:hypothetical protein [Hymenobacter volaticus]|uniref:MFS transporter n=1 Tax=Hymenobacter volaticus TaxID=2932254 RepID=A0ABY4G2J8_9BACT|nr:hypothetical protein [Hymenobacter volaticus]UOQ65017.1 hypothetical protein MUN86_15780 [Hymenobacter volaticus]
MTDADFHRAIRRIRWRHCLHYTVQALVMGALMLAGGNKVAGGGSPQPVLASWPLLLLLGALLPLAGVLLYLISRRLTPNLRRPAEQNLRVYQSRMLLRNSLLSLLGLPLLVSYVFTRSLLELASCGVLLLALCLLTVPSAKTYQRWLLS